ncbi:MAG: DUF721 domain-containing protein [Bdellovibrionia bacterium]
MDDFDSNKKYRSKMKAGSEVLQSLFENGKSPLSEQFLRWKLWAKWPEVVGPTIAKNAEPVAYKNGILFLWVKNSTWMQQMVFLRDQIQTTINQKMNQNFVRSIRFTLDRRDVPTQDNTEFKKYIEMLTPQNEDEN